MLIFLEQYGWFFNREDNSFRGIRKGGPAIGYEESIKLIEKVVETDGPFDGIFGFSQGACFVGLLCDLQHRGSKYNHTLIKLYKSNVFVSVLPFKFNFAIMSSGFKSGSLPHMKYYSDTIAIPSLHIYGMADKIIPTEMSSDLASCFDNPMVVTHPGGHYLPATATQKHDFQAFIKNLRR